MDALTARSHPRTVPAPAPLSAARLRAVPTATGRRGGMPVLHLDNPVRAYDWGSPTRIPDLLGREPDGSPAAELWLGAHPGAPSRLRTPGGGAGRSLEDLVGAEPHDALGRRVADRFGPRLPFLLKVLAADRALSLQVHPRPHLARAGYHRETRAGLPAGHAQRSFHDDQHKPEMIVALSPFEALAGFRSPRTVLRLLDGLDGALLDAVRGALADRPSTAGVRAATEALVAARTSPSTAADVAAAVAAVARRHEAGNAETARADATVLTLAEQHPGDPGALVSLLLHRVTLEPGEAMYVPAGEVHAYLSGFGVEVMAASDNVLRAGLTTKHVDAPALLECASFAPRPPARPATLVSGGESVVVTYRAPVEEFALTFADVVPGEPVALAPDGPRVVLALDGEARLLTNAGRLLLRRGESCFVPDAAGPLTVDGSAHVVCAWVP
ncbi:mannose-6-phosphate isomerase, class I [Krasilnikoviella flava]|uniref:mannose-6-phosphate isomerase n=1 Tax=Krasilnikoviella flava TaxID=526729 RepID=A0A1T5IA08_9MICO|nr:mannose-6-phosphate isomerase, class I [Krasilnikoviella flava]SKC36015.1 mannose-6-phosphate isomerase, type 1 [Krasilnikoviella flava]